MLGDILHQCPRSLLFPLLLFLLVLPVVVHLRVQLLPGELFRVSVFFVSSPGRNPVVS